MKTKMFIVITPTNKNDFAPSTSRFVRGANTNLFIFEKVKVPEGAIPRTKVTFWSEVNLGGHIKMKYLKNRTKSFLSSVSEMRSRFDKSAQIDGSSSDCATNGNKSKVFDFGGSPD